MRREIKFRGKRIENGEWVEGGFGILGEDTDLEKSVIIVSTLDTNSYVDRFYFTDVDVTRESVGQFTGLKDKNGREIYEGDISKIKINIQGGRSVESINKVIYDKGAFHYEAIKAKRSTPMFGVGYACEVEVIGNIHDNPELLK